MSVYDVVAVDHLTSLHKMDGHTATADKARKRRPATLSRFDRGMAVSLPQQKDAVQLRRVRGPDNNQLPLHVGPGADDHGQRLHVLPSQELQNEQKDGEDAGRSLRLQRGFTGKISIKHF